MQTTIRVLGGLLSAHYLTSDNLFLERARWGRTLPSCYLNSTPPDGLRRELADRILPVFETPTGLPTSMVNLCESKKVCRLACVCGLVYSPNPCFFQDGVCISRGVLDKDNNNLVSTAEVATLQLEFKYLSYLTDEDGYWRPVEKVSFLPQSDPIS